MPDFISVEDYKHIEQELAGQGLGGINIDPSELNEAMTATSFDEDQSYNMNLLNIFAYLNT